MTLALSRFRVLDLTRARAGPTAARQLADLGADVIKVEERPKEAFGLGGPRHGPDFQNLHRNKRSLTLNLKEPDGVAIFKRLAAEADVIVENYRPGGEAPARHRLRVDPGHQPAHRLRQHLRLRPGRAVRGPPWGGPDRPGHGGAHVDHRAPGPGAGAGRGAHRGPDGGDVPRHRDPHRSRRARGVGVGDSGCTRRSSKPRSRCSTSRPRAGPSPGRSRPQAGKQPPDRHPDRGVRDRGRTHQHRGGRRAPVRTHVPGDGVGGVPRRPALPRRPMPATRTATP